MFCNYLKIKRSDIICAGIAAVILSGCQIKDTANKKEAALEVASKNKKTVLQFYQQLFGDKDISAVDKYVAADYIQYIRILKTVQKILKRLPYLEMF